MNKGNNKITELRTILQREGKRGVFIDNPTAHLCQKHMEVTVNCRYTINISIANLPFVV